MIIVDCITLLSCNRHDDDDDDHGKGESSNKYILILDKSKVLVDFPLPHSFGRE